MEGRTEQPNEGRPDDRAAEPDPVDIPPIDMPSIGMSRRAFTTKFGVGSATAVGMVWAAPKISTIRFAAKAAVGSPGPTGSTTTSSSTSTSIGQSGGGSISVSDTTPCAGDSIHVRASGFAPKTAVSLEIDSAANPLGITTADGAGKVNVELHLSRHAPTGQHRIVATGIQPGGRTLSLSAPVNIRSSNDCEVENEGTTSTTVGSSPQSTAANSTTTSSPATTTPTTEKSSSSSGGGKVQGGGSLAFTGTDAIDLALVGSAATVGGRLLYALARPRDDEDEDDDD